jgi:hypothetical protein
MAFENKDPRMVFGPRKEEDTGYLRKLQEWGTLSFVLFTK